MIYFLYDILTMCNPEIIEKNEEAESSEISESPSSLLGKELKKQLL